MSHFTGAACLAGASPRSSAAADKHGGMPSEPAPLDLLLLGSGLKGHRTWKALKQDLFFSVCLHLYHLCIVDLLAGNF